MTTELWGIMAAIAIWLIKISWSQHQFRKNHLAEMAELIARLDERMKNVEEDVKTLFKRLNQHINGSVK